MSPAGYTTLTGFPTIPIVSILQIRSMGVKVNVFYLFAPLRFVVSLGKPAGLNESGCQNSIRRTLAFRFRPVKIVSAGEENFQEIPELIGGLWQSIGRLFRRDGLSLWRCRFSALAGGCDVGLELGKPVRTGFQPWYLGIAGSGTSSIRRRMRPSVSSPSA
jgi:hypothetical protein